MHLLLFALDYCCEAFDQAQICYLNQSCTGEHRCEAALKATMMLPSVTALCHGPHGINQVQKCLSPHGMPVHDASHTGTDCI